MSMRADVSRSRLEERRRREPSKLWSAMGPMLLREFSPSMSGELLAEVEWPNSTCTAPPGSAPAPVVGFVVFPTLLTPLIFPFGLVLVLVLFE